MDKKPMQRRKQQNNGLLEPYTVMLDQPVVVRASSIEEAEVLARKVHGVEVTNGNEEEGDDR